VALKLSNIVLPGAVIPELAGKTRDEVIAEMVSAVVAAGAAPAGTAEELTGKVLEREKRGSTGFGAGVAVPHVKHKLVSRMSASIGVSKRGVDFNALDRGPVYSIVLLVSPEDRPEDHLKAMEVIFKNLSKEQFRRFLRQAASAQDVMSLVDEVDNQQLAG
jgi:mannitol/fructose-specific phosphotransferase system IIA component (Ntr-type)